MIRIERGACKIFFFPFQLAWLRSLYSGFLIVNNLSANLENRYLRMLSI